LNIHNQTKAKLQAGETVAGCFVRYPSPALVEFVGYLGWDFIIFDGEHGSLMPQDVEAMAMAAELRGVTPFVRATTNQAHVILRFLDAGPLGIHIPWVNSAAEAEAAVQSVKYHPRGKRGLAGVRAAKYGQEGPLSEYIEVANRETLVVIHIETITAVEQIDTIAAVDGVDVIFIGPTDLSHSMGLAGQFNHPDVQDAIRRVSEAVDRVQPALGAFIGNPADIPHWRSLGVRYIATGLEAILKPAARAFLDAARAA